VTSELYDPKTGTWSATGSLSTAGYAAATLLPNGQVLAAGGGADRTSAELYDPASGTWSTTASLATGRFAPLTLLTNGEVLASGGIGTNFGSVANAEIYDVGLGFSKMWRPDIARATAGNRLQVTGTHFQGISQASGGNTQDSSSNYPIVQLRSIDSSQVTFLPVDPVRGWSDTSFTSVRLNGGFPSGPALATVFTNGIPSNAKYLVLR